MTWSRARAIVATVLVCSLFLTFGSALGADAQESVSPPGARALLEALPPVPTDDATRALSPVADPAPAAAVLLQTYSDPQGDSGWAYDLKELEVGYDPAQTSFAFWFRFFDPFYGVTPYDAIILWVDTDQDTTTGVSWPGDNVGTDRAIVFESDGSTTIAYLMDTPGDDPEQWTLVDYLTGYEDVETRELFATVPLAWLDDATRLRMIVESYYEDAEGADYDWLPETGYLAYGRDIVPPSASISYPWDQYHYIGSVTPTLRADDEYLSSVEATLDGEPYPIEVAEVSGWTVWFDGPRITAPGTHTITVTATDESWNQARAETTFTLEADVYPPIVEVTGVVDGYAYDCPKIPSFTVDDDSYITAFSATLNGEPYVARTPISDLGDYTLIVAAEDEWGNSASTTVHFSIVPDTTPPALVVGGVYDGAKHIAPVRPYYFVAENHDYWVSATLNGEPYTFTTIATDGAYTLVVTAEDEFGNTSTVTVIFTIELDLIPPEVTVSGVEDGATYGDPVYPVFDATDEHLTLVEGYLDSLRFYSGTEVSDEGPHTLRVVALDEGDNQTSVVIRFTIDIDNEDPVITISGVAEGELYTSPIAPTYSATDANLDTVAATLDGLPFESGAVVSAVGPHTLVVTATDTKGHAVTKTVHFTLAPGHTTLRGTDRYNTAILVSQRAYPETAPAVLLATGENFPDALCAAPLATAVGGPLLLTPTRSLSTAVKNEILRLQPSKVYVIGLPDAPETALKAALPTEVEIKRIRGTDRYDTAKRVAEELLVLLGPREKVVIAPGNSFPDALSAAPLAAANGWPILLTPQFSSTVPASTAAAISALGATTAVVVGTHSDPGIEDKVKFVGVDRYDTCGKIADYALGYGMSYSHIGFATGQNFPDALAAGPLLAADHGILLLTGSTSVPTATRSRLTANGSGVEQAIYIGLADPVINQLKGFIP